MAEEFQAEVCGESWWSSPRATTFNGSSLFGGGGGCWQNDFINLKTSRSTDESSGGYATTISPDSALQIITSSPSAAAASTTTCSWNQALLVNIGRNEESDYNQTLPEILNNLPTGGGLNFGMEQDQHQHSSTNFMTTNSGGNLVSTTTTSSCGYPTSLLQTLFDTTSPAAAAAVYDFEGSNLNEFDPAGFSNCMLKPKLQHNNSIAGGGLRLANKTPFWNAAASLDLNDNRAAAAAAAGFFASTQSRFLPSSTNIKSQNEQIRDLGSSVKKSSGEPTFKRPRLETPSPLPTFKVRKEKLGDRVTALQQLVSPFGKTDTASVLHEAIEYIKHLHDQVNVLSTPYMKNGATTQMQQTHNKVKDNTEAGGAAKQQDLRSRGLCLVPVSVTFPVATETAPDYWTSSFGSTFK